MGLALTGGMKAICKRCGKALEVAGLTPDEVESLHEWAHWRQDYHGLIQAVRDGDLRRAAGQVKRLETYGRNGRCS
jgi:hypothetical protein